MKSSLRFALLFALIVVGKLTKQATTVRSTVKMLHTNSLPTSATSFFTRQVSLPAASASSSRLWNTGTKPEQQVQFE